jgi:hypothetical protein
MLGVFGRSADKHDVAGLPMKSDQPGTILLPAIAKLAQHIRGVVVTRWRLYPQGVKFLGFLECVRDLGKARNDSTTVAINADGAAFPVTFAGFVRMFELPEQGIGYAVDAFIIVFVTQALDSRNEAEMKLGQGPFSSSSSIGVTCAFLAIVIMFPFVYMSDLRAWPENQNPCQVPSS